LAAFFLGLLVGAREQRPKLEPPFGNLASIRKLIVMLRAAQTQIQFARRGGSEQLT